VIEHYYESVAGWFGSPAFYGKMVARVRDGGTLVEVGCWQGRSLSCLLVEAANSGKSLHVFGVDHWQGSVGEPELCDKAASSDLLGECQGNCERAGYPFTLLSQPSVEAALQFSDGSVDFVFLDGSHTMGAVLDDIDAWRPKVRPGGILSGHDEHAHGVAQAVRIRFEEFSITNGCWFTEI
jgi:hypothetical protein